LGIDATLRFKNKLLRLDAVLIQAWAALTAMLMLALQINVWLVAL
jgi:hypothetical protein